MSPCNRLGSNIFLGLLNLLVLFSEALVVPTSPSKDTVFDYVIVGGGTCGLVLANRLSEDPSISVAVIEAGASQTNNPNVTTVGAFGLGIGTDIDWAYESTPQVFAKGRSLLYDAGKGLGGTSLINGETYIRAATSQIDAWESVFGNPGWNWANLFPYYLKSETFQIPNANQTQEGCNYTASVHGESGPVEVGWFDGIAPRSTYLDVRAAWEGAGFTWIPDPNTGNSSGASTNPLTVSRDLNIRWDAARAYLSDDVAQRSNLQVFENTVAQKVAWGDDQGNQAHADGVEVVDQNGNFLTVTAAKEVILSAGSLKSPVLLESSGVGNADVLRSNGIPLKLELSSVGFNLQDQPNVQITNSAAQGLNFTGYPTYATFATAIDLFGSNVSNVEEYVRAQIPEYAQTIVSRSSTNATTSSIQEQLLNSQTDLIFKDLIPVAELLTAVESNFALVALWGLIPFSRGSVHINGSSVENTPLIDPNFFMLDFDNILQSAAARRTRDFLSEGQQLGWAGTELVPGTANVSSNATDEQWLAYFKDSFNPNYHPCGTAAMMARELGGVVDSNTIVYGTNNVRVVDASILPAQVDGHLTSTLYAVAERAADIILGKCKQA